MHFDTDTALANSMLNLSWRSKEALEPQILEQALLTKHASDSLNNLLNCAGSFSFNILPSIERQACPESANSRIVEIGLRRQVSAYIDELTNSVILEEKVLETSDKISPNPRNGMVAESVTTYTLKPDENGAYRIKGGFFCMQSGGVSHSFRALGSKHELSGQHVSDLIEACESQEVSKSAQSLKKAAG